MPTGKVLERCITLSTRIGRLQRRCHRLSIATRASLALDWSTQAPRHRWVSLVVLTGHQQENHQFQFTFHLPKCFCFFPRWFQRESITDRCSRRLDQMEAADERGVWSHLVSEPCFPQSSRLACQGDKPLRPRTLFEPNSSPNATKCYRPNPNRLRGNLRIALAVLPCIFHGTPFTPTSKVFLQCRGGAFP